MNKSLLVEKIISALENYEHGCNFDGVWTLKDMKRIITNVVEREEQE